MDESLQPENKNRLLAGISYLLVFLGIIGIIINAVIYYKTKNKYARFHAGQAIWLKITLWIVTWIVSLIIIGPTILAGRGISALEYETLTAATNQVTLYFGYAAIGIILLASILAFMGKYFKIPFVAWFVEK